MSLAEAKMQSTGQGGPEVNRDIEVLFDKINELVRDNNSLRETIGGLSGGSTGTPPPASGNTGATSDPGDSFVPTYATMATLADQGTGTENAWTTVASGAPAGSRFAIIIFEVSSTDDADVGDLKWRTSSGAAEILAVYVNGDEDDASPRMMCFVPLTASGDLDYKFTNTSATTINWLITYCGYVS